ncbi:MAG: type II secretion system F family protein [Actinomycetota bacterium]|nr:type II secretion system F family protein [Actinomycetota bacterium]
MNPIVAGGAMTTCLLVATWGCRLLRDRGPASRLERKSHAAHPTEARRSLVGRLYDTLGDHFAPRVMRGLSKSRRASINRKLNAAGRPGGMTVEGYAGRKAGYTIILGGAGLLFALRGNYLLGALFIVFGWFYTDIWLGGVARARQSRIEHDLPDFLDILAVTVAAGVGFRSALGRVAEALEGPLSEEIMTALRQMELGMSRRQALEGIKGRNTSESLNQFVTALLQAEELGVPLADALGHLAEDMRRSFYQTARRRAAKAAPRVSLIVSTVIVPGAIILIIASVIAGTDVDFGNLFGA